MASQNEGTTTRSEPSKSLGLLNGQATSIWFWNVNLQSSSKWVLAEAFKQVVDRGHGVVQYKPKLLICTGIGERDNFFRAFTDGQKSGQIQLAGFAISVARFDQTLVCVPPFFGGASGINSYGKNGTVGQLLQVVVTAQIDHSGDNLPAPHGLRPTYPPLYPSEDDAVTLIMR